LAKAASRLVEASSLKGEQRYSRKNRPEPPVILYSKPALALKDVRLALAEAEAAAVPR
jgi:hypothetical protein